MTVCPASILAAIEFLIGSLLWYIGSMLSLEALIISFLMLKFLVGVAPLLLTLDDGIGAADLSDYLYLVIGLSVCASCTIYLRPPCNFNVIGLSTVFFLSATIAPPLITSPPLVTDIYSIYGLSAGLGGLDFFIGGGAALAVSCLTISFSSLCICTIADFI